MWSCVNVVQVFKCLCTQSSFAARNSGHQPCSVKSNFIASCWPDDVSTKTWKFLPGKKVFVYRNDFGCREEEKYFAIKFTLWVLLIVSNIYLTILNLRRNLSPRQNQNNCPGKWRRVMLFIEVTLVHWTPSADITRDMCTQNYSRQWNQQKETTGSNILPLSSDILWAMKLCATQKPTSSSM